MKHTPREQQIVALLLQGKTNKEIGLALNISQYTARTIISRMFVRFNVTSRVELVAVLFTILARLPIGAGPATPRAADRRVCGERRSTPRQLRQE